MLSKGSSPGANHATSDVLFAVGPRRTGLHGGVEDHDDVGRVVAIGVGHAVLRSAQHRQHGAKAEYDPRLFLGLSTRGRFGRLVGFDRSADGGPVPCVDEADEKESTLPVAGKDRDRGENE